MKKYQKCVTVYEFPDGFIVESSRQGTLVDFYLGHEKYGVKSLMFGVCNIKPEDEEELVFNNIAECIAIYKLRYFDADDMVSENSVNKTIDTH